MLKIYDSAIVGGGAAGLMAAIQAARREFACLIIEKNSYPTKKLLITGKGRCNLTNNCDIQSFLKNVHRNPRFLYSSLAAFPPQALMAFFEAEGLELKTERGNRVFPVSDKASDVARALARAARAAGARTVHDEAEAAVKKDGFFEIRCKSGLIYRSRTLLLATGGLSYPSTGSTGDGYRFAKIFGHSITPPRASLVPLECRETYCADLEGLSLRNVTLKLLKKGGKKPLFAEQGEMLFTSFGISGPLVLSASAFIESDEFDMYKITIDLKPALDIETLDKRLQKDFTRYINKNFSNALCDLLPAKLIPVIVALSGIVPEEKVNGISRERRRAFAELLKNFPLSLKAPRPIEEAVITSGGVSVKEIDPATMQSKLVPGLYFAGELIDVDAYTGGFNLQIAFSTAYAAGANLNPVLV
ncbi:MAG: NAD(P)/FAD-dependent oxidoreductase [Oscillospiraceae bacterium]|jgi:predicted Rossmann fold flavoprotein|nr:NAD(P)/FAD-dependent oxidoreductase [Oscillospiraceae bacterium]